MCCHVLKSLKIIDCIGDENNALYMYNDQISSLHWCCKHKVVNVYHYNDGNIIML